MIRLANIVILCLLISSSLAYATPPDIVGTTINAPISGGKYQLQQGISYTITVTVAAGNVTYDIRLEGNGISSILNLSPVYRDDTIDLNSGNHIYTFTITPDTTGDYQVAFQLRDRGTWNVFDVDGGVAVHVYVATPPDIVGTTINAPISGGKYQLQQGQSYTVTVTVAAGNVTYDIRLEDNNIDNSLNLSPSYRNDTIDLNSGNHTYTFTITPDTTGDYQVAFQLRDRGTWNVFDVDDGVAVRVYAATPPDIVGTTINAPLSGGKYQLQQGVSYTVTVTVAAGNVTYDIRLEDNNIDSSLNLSPSYRDDTIALNSGNHIYTFTITPDTTGDYQVAFQLTDRGTWNVFDIDDGVAVHVYVATTPDIVGTIINAPLSGGKYQLQQGVSYTVTVTVAAGNVTYDIRLEGNGISSTLNLSPVYQNDTIDLNSGNHIYTFTITPDTTGDYQVAFQLRDRGTWNVFDVDGGVAVTVYDQNPPSIVSTTINAPESAGKYQLIVGNRYLVTVWVRAGSEFYHAGLEFNENYILPSSANLHNVVLNPEWIGEAPEDNRDYIAFPPFSGDKEFLFTLTPSDSGDYQIAFQLRDLPPNPNGPGGTGLPFGEDTGVVVRCYSDLPGIHGIVTSKKTGQAIHLANVYLSNGMTDVTDADGSYHFQSVSSGLYDLTIEKNGYSSFRAVDINCPDGGIRIDCSLEDEFSNLKAAGLEYITYDDRSYGSTIMHVVKVMKAYNKCYLALAEEVPGESAPCESGIELMTNRPNTLVAINGGYFYHSNIYSELKPEEYFYLEGLVYDEGHEPSVNWPVLV